MSHKPRRPWPSRGEHRGNGRSAIDAKALKERWESESKRLRALRRAAPSTNSPAKRLDTSSKLHGPRAVDRGRDPQGESRPR